jgi:hypothetical protein
MPRTRRPLVSAPNRRRGRVSPWVFVILMVVLTRSDRLLKSSMPIYGSPALCEVEVPSILKGGDYVKFTISTPTTTFAVTATGIVPARLSCCP